MDEKKAALAVSLGMSVVNAQGVQTDSAQKQIPGGDPKEVLASARATLDKWEKEFVS